MLLPVAAALVAGSAVAVFAVPRVSGGGHSLVAPTKATATADLARLPLAFQQNAGQADHATRFLTRQDGYDFLIGTSGARMVLNGAHQKQPSVLAFRTLGSNAGATVTGDSQLPGRVNYFQGRSAANWHTDIPTYSSVGVQHVYPGIDLSYSGDRRQIEYTFTVAAGANPAAIRLGVRGATNLHLDGAGDLVVRTPAGPVVEHAPVAYQPVGGRRRPVRATFSLHGDTVAFALARYDHAEPVVIDPVLTYSTYLGGDNGDGQAYGVAVTAAGDIVVTGSTTSPTFPSTESGSYASDFDTFVTELDPSGSSVIYSTYIGGDKLDQATAVALDSAGDAYITGYTDSNDYPLQAAPPSTNDVDPGHIGRTLAAFVTELNASGNALVYSTLIGGFRNDEAEAIAVGSDGAAYITGLTSSVGFPGDFPTTAGAYQQLATTWSAFVTKLEPAGTDPERIAWSTYLGGTGASTQTLAQPSWARAAQAMSEGLAVAVDSAGNVYVGGMTLATGFPTTTGAFRTSMASAGTSGFVSKLSSDGSTLDWSTYLGGLVQPDQSQVNGLSLVGSTVVVVGTTNAADFPTTTTALQRTYGGNPSDAFVAELKPTTSGTGQLAYSTFLGGDGYDDAEAVATNATGDVYVTGTTGSDNFPVASPFSPSNLNGSNTNAFVTRLEPSKAGSAGLVWSSYLGGGWDDGLGVALDKSGDVFAVGDTESTSFPTVNPLLTAPSSFGETGFLAEVAANASSHILSLSTDQGTAGDSVTITGAGFTGATAVSFGGVPAADFNVGSDTTITATVPALAVDGNVTVTTPQGTSNGVAFDVTPVIGISPTDGAAGHVIDVTGTSLVKPTALTLNGAKIAFKTVTVGTELSFVVPTTATNGPVAVTTANGVATAATSFTVDPAVTGFAPTKAAAGAAITISGTGLGSTSLVDFSGAPGQHPSIVSPTSVKVTVPAGATTGALTVHTAFATVTTTGQFTPLATITGFDQASYQQGDAVTINGSGLTGGTFMLGTFTLTDSGGSTASQFFTTVPAGAITAPVTVTTAAGRATGPKLLVRPTITSLSAPDGASGTALTLTGATFTGTKSVLFASAAGPAKAPAKFVVFSATQLNVTVPAAAATGAIAVMNAGGTTDSSSFTVDPGLASFTPGTGGSGTTVTVHGSGFVPGEQASVGGVDASTVDVLNSTTLTFVVPPAVTTGDVDIWTDPAHKAQSATPFTVNFTATQLEETVAPGGSRITINGVGLTGVTSVHFNDGGTPLAVAPASIASDGTSLTVIVPSTGTADGVVGIYKSATHTTVPGTFTRLTLAAPQTIAAPGDTLTLTGNGFTGALVNFLNGWSDFTIVAAPISINGAGTALTVTVPFGFTGGAVQVIPSTGSDYLVEQPLLGLSAWNGHVGDSVVATSDAGTNLGDVVTIGGVAATVTDGTSSSITFTVTSGEDTGVVDIGGTSSTADFVVEPEIANVSPPSGPTGTAVTLTGDHLANITAASVDGTDVTNTITGNTASQLTVTIPDGDINGQISVSNANGTATAGFTVTLSIVSVSPGDASAGTTGIVITGVGFTDATAVAFNGTAASFVVNSDQQITATVPNGATAGPITVTTGAGTATSPSSFTIDP